MTQNLDLNTLRKVAEQATPGNWIPFEPGDEPGYWWVWQEEKLPWYGGIAQVSDSDPGSICQAVGTDGRDTEQDKADAIHIATFQPSTVLALLTQLEQAKQTVERKQRALHTLDRIIERQCETAVLATNSQDVIDTEGDWDGDWDVVWDRLAELADKKREAEAQVARVREAVSEHADYAELTRAIIDILDGESNE